MVTIYKIIILGGLTMNKNFIKIWNAVQNILTTCFFLSILFTMRQIFIGEFHIIKNPIFVFIIILVLERIILKIILYKISYNIYKELENTFVKMKNAYDKSKEILKLEKKVSKDNLIFSRLFKYWTDVLLYNGKYYMSRSYMNKKHVEKIKGMVEETEKILESIE